MLAWLGDVLRSFAKAENKTGWIRRKIGDRLDGIRGLGRIVNTRKAVAFANAAAARRRQAGRQWINQPSANTTKAMTPAMSQRTKARIPPDGDSVASAGSSGL